MNKYLKKKNTKCNTSATALKGVLFPSCSPCFAMASAALFADFAISSENSRPFLPSSLFWASSRPYKSQNFIQINKKRYKK